MRRELSRKQGCGVGQRAGLPSGSAALRPHKSDPLALRALRRTWTPTPAPRPVTAGAHLQECPSPPDSGLSPILYPGAQRERLRITVRNPGWAPGLWKSVLRQQEPSALNPLGRRLRGGFSGRVRPAPPGPRPPGGRFGEHRVEPQEAQVLGERPPRQRREPGLGRQPGRRRSHGLRVPTLARGRPDISRPAASRSAAGDRAGRAQRAPPHTFPRVPNGPPPLGRRRRLELEAPAQSPQASRGSPLPSGAGGDSSSAGGAGRVS